MASGKIFVSFRPHQSEADTQNVRSHLVQKFGRDQVIFDPAASLSESGEQVCAVVVLIGEHWLQPASSVEQTSPGQSSDRVYNDIEHAMARKTPLLPVIMPGGSMPKEHQLPDVISQFAYRNEFKFRHDTLRHDLDRLVAKLGGHVPSKATRRARSVRIFAACFLIGAAVIGLATALLIQRSPANRILEATGGTLGDIDENGMYEFDDPNYEQFPAVTLHYTTYNALLYNDIHVQFYTINPDIIFTPKMEIYVYYDNKWHLWDSGPLLFSGKDSAIRKTYRVPLKTLGVFVCQTHGILEDYYVVNTVKFHEDSISYDNSTKPMERNIRISQDADSCAVLAPKNVKIGENTLLQKYNLLNKYVEAGSSHIPYYMGEISVTEIEEQKLIYFGATGRHSDHSQKQGEFILRVTAHLRDGTKRHHVTNKTSIGHASIRGEIDAALDDVEYISTCIVSFMPDGKKLGVNQKLNVKKRSPEAMDGKKRATFSVKEYRSNLILNIDLSENQVCQSYS